MPQLSGTKEPRASAGDPRYLTSLSSFPLCQRFCWLLEHATNASNGGFSPGVHLFPFRTESLSPGAPMVLPSPVGESVAANLCSAQPCFCLAFASDQKQGCPRLWPSCILQVFYLLSRSLIIDVLSY